MSDSICCNKPGRVRVFLSLANHRKNEPLTQRCHRTCRAETIKPHLLIRTSKRSSLWLPPISSPTYTNQRFSGLLYYNKKGNFTNYSTYRLSVEDHESQKVKKGSNQVHHYSTLSTGETKVEGHTLGTRTSIAATVLPSSLRRI
jgi:hypothetical protein